MEVVSIERSTYEELLTSCNSFVTQMRAMADRGTDKRLGDWLDNQDVCQMLNISQPEDVENILHVVASRDKDSKMCNLKTVCL